MTLASFVTPGANLNRISIDCPTHGHVLDAQTEIQAFQVANIHNKTYHPRALNRMLNKKR